MTRKVSVFASSPTRFDSSSPATPASRPDPSQAAASTRRTGTPERRGDLTIVGQRPHRGAQSS